MTKTIIKVAIIDKVEKKPRYYKVFAENTDAAMEIAKEYDAEYKSYLHYSISGMSEKVIYTRFKGR